MTLWLPVLAIAFVTLLIWSIAAQRRMRRLRAALATNATELERLQHAFQRFAPSEIIDRIIASGVSAEAEIKEVTVLFCDLVGYTALSERLDPATLLATLNGYFETMSAAISEHNGHVATFIGDGILAYFGALQPNPWQADDAAAAALAMRRALRAYNHELERRGRPPLAVGIGIHRGKGLAGLIGSRERTEYAVVGRTINLASRIQDLTRELDAEILVSTTVRRHLAPRYQLRPMPAQRVKGVSDPVPTFALDGYAAAPAACPSAGSA